MLLLCALIAGSGSEVWATDVTFTAGTDQGSNGSNGNSDTMSKDGITISGTDMATTTAEYRIYASSTMTISSSVGNITKIVITSTAAKGAKYGPEQLSTKTGSYSTSTGSKDGTWTGNASSVSFTASSQCRASQIVVTYTPATPTYALTFTSSSAGGTIVVTNGVSSVTSGDKFEENTVLNIVATPADGYDFTSWSAAEATLGNATSASTTLTMPAAAVELTATFTPQTIVSDITLDDVVNGSIISDKATANVGETVTITATPNEGFVLGEWTVLDDNADAITVTPVDENTATFVMPATDVLVSATFLAKHTVTYYIGGVVNSVERVHGSTLDLDDAPTTGGLAFAFWSSTNNTASPTEVLNTVVVNSDMTLYAVFVKEEGEAYYELVEANKSDWRGDYLIAYSDEVFANGKIAGTESNSIGAASSSVKPKDNLDGKVISGSWGDQYYVTLEAVDDNDLSKGYVLKTQDGNYNYQTKDDNGIASAVKKSTAESYPITVNYVSSSEINLTLSTKPVFRYNSVGSIFRFYKSTSYSSMGNVYLYERKITTPKYSLAEPENVTVTSVRYATYVPTMKVAVPEGVTAYIVSETTSSKATLSSVTVIPKDSPVIIKSETSGSKTFVATNDAASDVTGNLLHYSDSSFDAHGEYVLADGASGIGFYPATSGQIAARKAYLNNTLNANYLAFCFDDENTGISITELNNETGSADYYNLAGQRVAQPVRGLYICNSKKVIIK